MNIFFSVGEPSGDQHAAHLMGELGRRRPGIECRGFGGPLMEQAGCRLDFRLTDLAVMGFLRVVPMLRQFAARVKQAEQIFAADPPDAVVLIDFPGFNWWIARRAKAAGIPVFYYLPPQLWAWAGWRVHRIRKYVDHVLCGLPFEPEWYARRGVEAHYVGHPFFDEVADYPLDRAFVDEWSGGRTVGLLPGSRRHEVEQNWPLMIEVVRHLAAHHPDVRFVTACYNSAFEDRCRELLAAADPTGRPPIEFFVGKTPEIIEVAECCLMVSGSVSLEMLARGTPAAVVYRTSALLYCVVRPLATVDSFTLPNLMAGHTVLPERPVVWRLRRAIADLTGTLDGWLRDRSQLVSVERELHDLRCRYGARGASGRAAEFVLTHLPARSRRKAA